MKFYKQQNSKDMNYTYDKYGFFSEIKELDSICFKLIKQSDPELYSLARRIRKTNARAKSINSTKPRYEMLVLGFASFITNHNNKEWVVTKRENQIGYEYYHRINKLLAIRKMKQLTGCDLLNHFSGIVFNYKGEHGVFSLEGINEEFFEIKRNSGANQYTYTIKLKQ